MHYKIIINSKLFQFIHCTKFYNTSFYRRVSVATQYNDENKSYRHQPGQEPLQYKTIGQLLDSAAVRFANHDAIVSCHENKKYSFLEIKNKAEQFAVGLISIGLQKGDHVAIWSPNNTQWYISLIAIAKAGLVAVQLNPAFQISETEYCLNKANVKAIIAPEAFKSQRYYDMLAEISPELSKNNAGHLKSEKVPSLTTVIIISQNNFPGAFNFDEIFTLSDSNEKLKKVEALISPDDGFNIQFTSGTTGKPKAALLSHFNLVNNAYYIGKRNELNENQRICCQVPFFHAFGIDASILAAMSFGTALVLPAPGFQVEESLKAIEKEKCTVVHGTPTMYVDLINKQKQMKRSLVSLDIAVCGGAPTSPQLFKDMLEILTVKKVKSIFGLTETTAVIFQNMFNEDEFHATSTVGFIHDHIEVKVIDKTGTIVPLGQPGELCVRGYCNMLGYWNDPDKTKEMIDETGWLKTGDQFILFEDGYGKIVGRFKDMIIRGGENIFPKEIEDFLNTHPNIIESQVFGVSDERMGEEIFACLRLREKTNLTNEELKEFCKGKISHFKIPRYMKVMKEFPKTASGKVQKFKIKEMVAKENL